MKKENYMEEKIKIKIPEPSQPPSDRIDIEPCLLEILTFGLYKTKKFITNENIHKTN
jgi:hypothetical protein